MGYVLEGGPRDGDFSDDLPLGYAAKHIVAGVVSESGSPTPRAEWLGVTTEADVQALPKHELTMMYDISRKIAADWHEPDAGRKAIAAQTERLAAKEMRRRGIFESHRPR